MKNNKILLLITVCSQNEDRILNQLKNLQKHENYLINLGITPIFVYGNTDIKTSINYEKIKLDLEEKYTNLCKKIVYSFEYVYKNLDFDYIIKIDDDTIFNIDRFDKNILNYDYIGRMFPKMTKNEITIDLPAYNMFEIVKLYPSIYTNKSFSFATGDFYILSKKSVHRVIKNRDLLDFIYNTENVKMYEDQFVGYCLMDDDILKFDIKYETDETISKVMQVTKQLTSIHPINTTQFPSLIEKSPEDQLQFILQSKLNSINRKVLLEEFKNNLKNTIYDFLNSKKNIGLG